FQHAPETHLATLFIALGVLGVIVGFEMFAPRFPGALLAVIGMTAASAYFHWGDHGVKIVGKVPSGLPRLGLPEVTWSDVWLILPIALSCFIVILAQSAATSRAYALRYRDNFNQNVDLLGLAMANAAAGCSGTFVVNGSPTKTGSEGESEQACEGGGWGGTQPVVALHHRHGRSAGAPVPNETFELSPERRPRRHCLHDRRQAGGPSRPYRDLSANAQGIHGSPGHG